MSCRARQRTMNSCSLGNLGVVHSGRWSKMVSSVTTLILFCVGKLHPMINDRHPDFLWENWYKFMCHHILCWPWGLYIRQSSLVTVLGQGIDPQTLGSMPCRRKAHHGGVSKESSVRSWGRLNSMGFVGDWTGWIDGWESSAYGISLLLVYGIPSWEKCNCCDLSLLRFGLPAHYTSSLPLTSGQTRRGWCQPMSLFCRWFQVMFALVPTIANMLQQMVDWTIMGTVAWLFLIL